MKKINIILITLFSIIGAIVIYNYSNKHNANTKTNNSIVNEYNLVTNSILSYKSIDEINSLFNNKSGIVFMCIKENEWCNYYAKYLNEISLTNDIKEIYYINLKQDRQYNTSGYRKLLNQLKDYVLKDDENNYKIFVPTVIFIKDGIIIEYDNETSVMTKNISPNEYWTEEKVEEFNNKITSFISNYKEEDL